MKYIVMWNSGYGDNHEVINADSQEEAEEYAYEAWHEEVQSQAVF